MITDPIRRWHDVVRTRDRAALAALLDDGVVFYSPVFHMPQVGEAITLEYLGAAMDVFSGPTFHDVREIVGPRDAALEFTVTIDDVLVDSVDLIEWSESGRVVDFKGMIRPLKAMDAIHRAMGALLARG